MQEVFKVEMVDGGWRGCQGVGDRDNMWSGMYNFTCITLASLSSYTDLSCCRGFNLTPENFSYQAKLLFIKKFWLMFAFQRFGKSGVYHIRRRRSYQTSCTTTFYVRRKCADTHCYEFSSSKGTSWISL